MARTTKGFASEDSIISAYIVVKESDREYGIPEIKLMTEDVDGSKFATKCGGIDCLFLLASAGKSLCSRDEVMKVIADVNDRLMDATMDDVSIETILFVVGEKAEERGFVSPADVAMSCRIARLQSGGDRNIPWYVLEQLQETAEKTDRRSIEKAFLALIRAWAEK